MKSIHAKWFYVIVDNSRCGGSLCGQRLESHNCSFPASDRFSNARIVDCNPCGRYNQRAAPKENGETDGDGGIDFSTETSRTAIYFGWLIGFGVLIWAIGIVYSIPIYVFGYLKIVGKYGWLKSGIYAAAAVAVIVILFEYVFRVAWPEAAFLSILHL